MKVNKLFFAERLFMTVVDKFGETNYSKLFKLGDNTL
jgi:hypothetical protein